MDRSQQTPYNLRSFGQQIPPNASGPSFPSSTSTRSGLNVSNTSSTMASQLQNNMAHTSQQTTFLSSVPTNQQRWGQTHPMAGTHNISTMQSSQNYGHGMTSAPVAGAFPQTENKLGGAGATAPFLKDFTLVAEAVKRVQMDMVMTEMESISL